MKSYYFDTSALSKRYVREVGTNWVRALANSREDNLILTARVTMVELHGAIARRRRLGTISLEDFTTATQAFTAHSLTEYRFIELDLKTIFLARDLIDRHPLRAYDAVQLASALIANHGLIQSNSPELVFVSSDNQLNKAAIAEGFQVDNPNQHS